MLVPTPFMKLSKRWRNWVHLGWVAVYVPIKDPSSCSISPTKSETLINELGLNPSNMNFEP